MTFPERNLSDLVLRIDAAIAEGREAELFAELDIPVGGEDQLGAARDDLIAGLLTTPEVGHRDLSFGEQPGWLRLGIMMAVAGWLDGQARTCPHHPTPEHPQPVHLALWLPGLVVCGECADLLVAPAHPGCAGCGMDDEVTSAGPRLMIVVAAFVAVRLFACADCMPRGQGPV